MKSLNNPRIILADRHKWLCEGNDRAHRRDPLHQRVAFGKFSVGVSRSLLTSLGPQGEAWPFQEFHCSVYSPILLSDLCSQSGTCLRVLVGHTNWVTCVTVLSCGLVASGSQDTTVRLWNPDVSKQPMPVLIFAYYIVAIYTVRTRTRRVPN